MEQTRIDRINELARKAKSGVELTPEEIQERTILRQEYVASVKASLVGHLDNTYIKEEDGSHTKLEKKEEQ